MASSTSLLPADRPRPRAPVDAVAVVVVVGRLLRHPLLLHGHRTCSLLHSTEKPHSLSKKPQRHREVFQISVCSVPLWFSQSALKRNSEIIQNWMRYNARL